MGFSRLDSAKRLVISNFTENEDFIYVGEEASLQKQNGGQNKETFLESRNILLKTWNIPKLDQKNN